LVLLCFIRWHTSAAAAALFKKLREFNDLGDGSLTLTWVNEALGSI
jgi:hypothetical protein